MTERSQDGDPALKNGQGTGADRASPDRPKGLEGFQPQQVVVAAPIHSGTLHYHLPSKQAPVLVVEIN
jgi:hypothetical protein